MPFQLSWFQPNQVLLLRMDGLVTVEDIQGIIVEATAMMADCETLVHFIVDTRTLRKIDNLSGTLKTVQSGWHHPLMGWMIVVGAANPAIKFGMDFIGLIIKSRYKSVSSMSEAEQFLSEVNVLTARR
ncbi:MAG: hypothetical protein GC204_02220 [Chloroflexi bacterium]|nr:hypothetical protein [Chloroflexota bacterium]